MLQPRLFDFDEPNTSRLPIVGLTYVRDYVTVDEEATLLANIDAQPWRTDLRRRVQHYGYRYDYKRRHAGLDSRLGALPGWLQPLAERLYAEGYIGMTPDQCGVNEYEPGQGIALHVDCVPCFGDTVLAVSLGSACVMDFSNPALGVKLPLLLERRSLLVMQGESRYAWRHGIAARKSDLIDGVVFRRERRVSVTFRKTILSETENETLE